MTSSAGEETPFLLQANVLDELKKVSSIVASIKEELPSIRMAAVAAAAAVTEVSTVTPMVSIQYYSLCQFSTYH
jgi:outer membrane scaffolding protein for murein synthesis (MipA/OmpV family)